MNIFKFLHTLTPQRFGRVEGEEGRWEVIDEEIFVAAAILDGFCNHLRKHPESSALFDSLGSIFIHDVTFSELDRRTAC